MSPGVAVSETVRLEVRRGVGGLNLVFADRGIARLRGNFQPLVLQDQIDGRDLILRLDRVVGNMIGSVAKTLGDLVEGQG